MSLVRKTHPSLRAEPRANAIEYEDSTHFLNI